MCFPFVDFNWQEHFSKTRDIHHSYWRLFPWFPYLEGTRGLHAVKLIRNPPSNGTLGDVDDAHIWAYINIHINQCHKYIHTWHGITLHTITHTYTYIYTHTHTHTIIHISIYTHTHIDIHTHTHTHIHTYTYSYTYTYRYRYYIICIYPVFGDVTETFLAAQVTLCRRLHRRLVRRRTGEQLGAEPREIRADLARIMRILLTNPNGYVYICIYRYMQLYTHGNYEYNILYM
jgi:hypothetical protein